MGSAAPEINVELEHGACIKNPAKFNSIFAVIKTFCLTTYKNTLFTGQTGKEDILYVL